MRRKIHSYIGLAKRSGKLVTGYHTCIHMIKSKKMKLVIVAEDVSQNTKDKFRNLAVRNGIPFFIWGNACDLSMMAGENNRGVFGITDENFAEVIALEIQNHRS